MRADIHTHAFNETAVPRIITRLNSFFKADCEGEGTLRALEENEKRAFFDCYVVLCAAATPFQVRHVNNFAISIRAGGGLSFGTVHVGDPNWEEELQKLRKGGIHGLKLHPDLQGFSMDDARLQPILEACEGHFVVLFHVGSPTGRPLEAPSSPWALLRVLRNFPKLDVIAAHFGGWHMWSWVPEALRTYRGDHLWLDTSSTSMFIDGHLLRTLLNLRPFEQYLFGSDWPLYRPGREYERFQRTSGYGDGRMEDLTANAGKLLKMYNMLPSLES